MRHVAAPADAWGSPLVEVERAVQERAKAMALDMARPEGLAALRSLLDDEIRRWGDDVKRGIRTYELADPAGVTERAWRNLAGYGPLEPLLADPDVWEIMINAPDQIFAKRHAGTSGYHDEVFHDDDHLLRTLTKVLDDASASHRKLDPAEGLQDAQLDNGSRLHIVHADIGRDGHILVNIRKFSGIQIRRLDELVDRDMLDAPVARFIQAAIRARLSIVFAGPPGSGKTTLLTCCAAELDPSLRIVVAEEVFETDVPLPNVREGTCRCGPADRVQRAARRLHEQEAGQQYSPTGCFRTAALPRTSPPRPWRGLEPLGAGRHLRRAVGGAGHRQPGARRAAPPETAGPGPLMTAWWCFAPERAATFGRDAGVADTVADGGSAVGVSRGDL